MKNTHVGVEDPMSVTEFFGKMSDERLCQFYKEVVIDPFDNNGHISMDAEIRKVVEDINNKIDSGSIVHFTAGIGKDRVYVTTVFSYLFHAMADRFYNEPRY